MEATTVIDHCPHCDARLPVSFQTVGGFSFDCSECGEAINASVSDDYELTLSKKLKVVVSQASPAPVAQASTPSHSSPQKPVAPVSMAAPGSIAAASSNPGQGAGAPSVNAGNGAATLAQMSSEQSPNGSREAASFLSPQGLSNGVAVKTSSSAKPMIFSLLGLGVVVVGVIAAISLSDSQTRPTTANESSASNSKPQSVNSENVSSTEPEKSKPVSSYKGGTEAVAHAMGASYHGDGRLKYSDSRKCQINWESGDAYMEFEIPLLQPGKYQVEIEYYMIPEQAGAKMKLSTSVDSVEFTVINTNEKFMVFDLGTIELAANEPFLGLEGISHDKRFYIDSRSVRLKKVTEE